MIPIDKSPARADTSLASTAGLTTIMKIAVVLRQDYFSGVVLHRLSRFPLAHSEGPWLSGYCYLNKGECNLNQSKDHSFVERLAKNNS